MRPGKTKADIIRDYAESTVGVADIKIAVRSQKTAKSMPDFMKRAMAECDSINVDQLKGSPGGNGRDPANTCWERLMHKARRR